MDSRISEKAYEEALEWLYSQLPMFSRIGAAAYKPGLETTQRLDSYFGHPHKKFKSIHIGGTNGKGSTSHMIASVLQAQGYKTALYTSPHLTDFRERMRINGKMIPKENVVKFVNNWRNNESRLKPSFFELTMMMAFDWFAGEHVDYAIIEVGMGGRLDSTNIITPLLSVITNISFDHTQFLGNTLEEIASEKAGIIKKGIPVVIGQAEGSVKGIFTEKAKELQSPIKFADEIIGDAATLTHEESGWKYENTDGQSFVVPLPGIYQKHNILTALTALAILRDSGVTLSDKNIEKGLTSVTSSTGLRGRWQVVGQKPTVVCDTGHNLDGIKNNMESIAAFYPDKKIRFVIGFVNDKDVSHIVDLFPKNGIYYFTQASIPRALPASEVANIFNAKDMDGKVFDTVKEAYGAALQESGEDDVIYIGGSTFVVADFLKEQEQSVS